MSNNPGRKGQPAPWVQREAEDRRLAFQRFVAENTPGYPEWKERRNEAAKEFRAEANQLYPDPWSNRADKWADSKLRAWDRKNPNPVTWEDHQRLEAAFAKARS